MRAVTQHACQSEVRHRQQKFKPAETALAVLEADQVCSRRAAVRRVLATQESEATM